MTTAHVPDDLRVCYFSALVQQGKTSKLRGCQNNWEDWTAKINGSQNYGFYSSFSGCI